jgi:gluconate 2-dehydrogenase
LPAAEVHGSTLGIIGMGRIGQGIAARGARLWHEGDLSQPLAPAPELEAECKASYVGKEELLARRPPGAGAALHPENHHTIGAAELAR